jgi:hypothetical protein
MSTPEETLTKTREELHAFIERLPLKQLETITAQVKIELEKLANSPEMQQAESRFKTIAKHLWGCIQTGEHAVVTDVHNFLVARGKIVPFTPPAPADAASVPADGSSPAPSVQA